MNIAGHSPGYLVLGYEAKLAVEGKEVAVGDLVKWMVQGEVPVYAVLHQDPTRYMAVMKAEFSRKP